MTDREKLVARLREIASRTPPICQYDRPFELDVMDKKITVYCKPFEQFQDLLREAADALANGVVLREKGEWILTDAELAEMSCSRCGFTYYGEYDYECMSDFCPNCGSDMRGDKA